LNRPRKKRIRLPCRISTIYQEINIIFARRSPSEVVSLLDGIGLFFVLSMRSSYSHSWYWLRAEAPPASKKIATIGQNIAKDKFPARITADARAEQVTAKVTPGLKS
jgi:hypothetical protein